MVGITIEAATTYGKFENSFYGDENQSFFLEWTGVDGLWMGVDGCGRVVDGCGRV